MGKKIISMFIVSLILSLSFSSVSSSEKKCYDYKQNIETSINEQELILLRGEFNLALKALDDTNSFNVKYAFPMNYTFQVPIFLYLLNDSTADILDYQIETDSDGLNKIVNFTIGTMKKDDTSKIHFSAWVLVKNKKFEDLPSFEKIPTIDELPEETKQWLVTTEVVQVDNPLVKLRAKFLRGLTDNLIKVVKRVARFTYKHRWISFYFQCLFNFRFKQDALTTLLLSGECVGKSHLGCALLRANGIPARVIYGVPATQRLYGSHSMVEYYVPSYGWVFSEIPDGFITFEPKTRLMLRVSYPWEENDTVPYPSSDRITGMHRWFWINNEKVTNIWFNQETKYQSYMRAEMENEIITDELTANNTFKLTKTVYHLYEYFQQRDLMGNNLKHFQNATSYQKEAIFELAESDNLDDYIEFLNKAQFEYSQIIL